MSRSGRQIGCHVRGVERPGRASTVDRPLRRRRWLTARGGGICVLQGVPQRCQRQPVASGDAPGQARADRSGRPFPSGPNGRDVFSIPEQSVLSRPRRVVDGSRTRDIQGNPRCSTSELPRPGPAPVSIPCKEHAPPTVGRRGRRASGPTGPAACLIIGAAEPRFGFAARNAGGSRTHLNRVAAGRLAVWLQRRPNEWSRKKSPVADTGPRETSEEGSSRASGGGCQAIPRRFHRGSGETALALEARGLFMFETEHFLAEPLCFPLWCLVGVMTGRRSLAQGSRDWDETAVMERGPNGWNVSHVRSDRWAGGRYPPCGFALRPRPG